MRTKVHRLTKVFSAYGLNLSYREVVDLAITLDEKDIARIYAETIK